MYLVVAMTAATSWLWYMTVSVGSTICMSPARVGIQWSLWPSRSLPVITARTPGILSASDASMPLIVAWAYGLRTMSSQSWPGRFTSSMYSPAPRMKRGSSLRLTEWPMPPISGLVRSWRGASSVVISSSSRSAGRGRCGRDVLAFGGRGGALGRAFALADGAGRLVDGLDDVDVAGAAAQDAADPVADLRLARVVVLAKQPVGLHDHPRRAEPALEPVLVPERLLQRVEGAPG